MILYSISFSTNFIKGKVDNDITKIKKTSCLGDFSLIARFLFPRKPIVSCIYIFDTKVCGAHRRRLRNR